MKKLKIKKGDTVRVISGKDKGAAGTVLRALPKEGRVVVEGIAIMKRHLRGTTKKVGQIIERPRSIDASNVALVEVRKK